MVFEVSLGCSQSSRGATISRALGGLQTAHRFVYLPSRYTQGISGDNQPAKMIKNDTSLLVDHLVNELQSENLTLKHFSREVSPLDPSATIVSH